MIEYSREYPRLEDWRPFLDLSIDRGQILKRDERATEGRKGECFEYREEIEKS